MLIPLDGSQAAEQVLPYARFLAKGLAIPVELLEVIDPDALAGLANPEQGRYLDTLLTERTASSRAYLQTVPDHSREATYELSCRQESRRTF
jgi:nucleotide-binding universal stress UspA family protein